MHPSWAAKQISKKNQININVQPQGKKITFDD
jgi:hypothetical protein